MVVLQPCTIAAVCVGLSLLHMDDPEYLFAAWEISAAACLQDEVFVLCYALAKNIYQSNQYVCRGGRRLIKLVNANQRNRCKYIW